MLIFLFALAISHLYIVNGQQVCQGSFDTTISGQCSVAADSCQGALLSAQRCELRGCCVTETSTFPTPVCLTENQFDILYNTSRATYLRNVLSYGINSAGICNNCQAKAAFLAIAATMTENFKKDEATGTDTQFAADDNRYGNNQAGDGSRFRRRGFFGLRGRTMYGNLQTTNPRYQSLDKPESVALIRNSIEIAALLWKKPDLQTNFDLTQYADGTFYGLSMIWYKLTGGIDGLAEATKHYSKFLRQLECGGDLYPGQGPNCQYNATHTGKCTADCIRGMEDSGEYCGCAGGTGSQCPNSPTHVRCCLDTCQQELKMDLGFVLDASGSIGWSDYQLQLQFTKDLLRRVNVGQNKTHVGIINYSSYVQVLTYLNADYHLDQKLQKVDSAIYYDGGTNTAAALREADVVFSPVNGLRRPEEGATPVLFVITDGESADRQQTIQAAQVLKDKEIHIVSVGVGSGPDLIELHAVCTPPASENYFAISNYAALEQKINQFTSKTCSEPVPIASNTTVAGEVSKGKYKFLKIEINAIGNKILITVKLFNGKVKLFYSFTSRNPKDPQDFTDYTKNKNVVRHLLGNKFILNPQTDAKNGKASNDEVTLVIDKPDEDVEFVYVGVKGIEDDNQFEVKTDDCAHVRCTASSLTMQFSLLMIIMCVVRFFL